MKKNHQFFKSVNKILGLIDKGQILRSFKEFQKLWLYTNQYYKGSHVAVHKESLLYMYQWIYSNKKFHKNRHFLSWICEKMSHYNKFANKIKVFKIRYWVGWKLIYKTVLYLPPYDLQFARCGICPFQYEHKVSSIVCSPDIW